jgi:exopolysaccharide biosynthesis WecB/TagA/CpsF family protein
MADGAGRLIDHGKKNLLGVNVNAVDYEAAVERIMTAAVEQRRCTVSALAVHGVMTGVEDPGHQYRLNQLDLVVPDGQPVRWALNTLYGTSLSDRVYGPQLTLRVCAEAAKRGTPVYLYGSRADVVEALAHALTGRFPGLRIAGFQPSQFRRLTEGEQRELVDEIRASGAQILLAGLGCPRQEVFAYEMGRYLRMPILAVGAAFDYHSGQLAEPPLCLQRAGLQWLYRLAQDPRRLWRRYLVLNTKFSILFFCQLLKLRIPDPAAPAAPRGEVRFG